MSGRNTERGDPYSRVTAKIIADLEKGVRTWLRPWNAEHAAGCISRPLRANGEAYRGINVVMLWAAAVEAGHSCPTWMTYRQAQSVGAQVRKGERGSLVVYADRIRREEIDEATGETAEREIPFMRAYTVFNCEQIDDLPARFRAPAAAPALSAAERIARAEAFFAALGADIRHGGAHAWYAIHSDRVQLPPFETFRDAGSYYATLAHEITHWTCHPSRLDRDLGRQRMGDEGYAREELVAELGAAFLAADLGLDLEPREDHAGYIASWLEVLKQDKRAIFQAAAHAQRAADYLHGRQPRAVEEETAERAASTGRES
jgi:antirestriction protein ArdC